MRHSHTNVEQVEHAVEQSPTLGPFVRRGLEGGCIACRKPISDHVDQRGDWIGCDAPNLPKNIPFFLIPDRRLMGRRVTPEPKPTNGRPVDERRSQPAPATLPQEPRSNGGTTSHPTPRHTSHRGLQGPQVTYVARYPVTHPAIGRLPNHDRKVYGLIVRARKSGATRLSLLEALGATKHTGRVDGAVRRLRLRKVIQVRAIEG